jgi:hypothetical protein
MSAVGRVTVSDRRSISFTSPGIPQYSYSSARIAHGGRPRAGPARSTTARSAHVKPGSGDRAMDVPGYLLLVLAGLSMGVCRRWPWAGSAW